MVEFENKGKPLSESEITTWEKTQGFSLPADYRQFLLTVNGGRPTPDVFDIPGAGASTVHTFNSLHDNSPYDLDEDMQAYSGRLPSRMITVASDDCGNVLAMSVSGNDLGFIYFWDHELEADPHQGEDPESIDNLTMLTKSFQEFVDSLRAPSPEEQ